MRSFGRNLAAVLLAALVSAPACARSEEARSPVLTSGPSAVIESKIDDLVSRMTLEEKIGQLTLVSNGPLMDWPAVASGEAGALLNFGDGAEISKAQRLAAETRLGIPLLFGLDVVHGFRTQFPMPLGEAAAFSPDLSRRVAEAMAQEARYVGVNWTYAPMADLSHDPRWGRIIEGFGEDPLLGAEVTAARVRGIQEGGLIATVKHFAGYGAPVGGRDYAATWIAEEEFRDFYLPAYQAGVRAGAGSVMSAFNALNGKPSTGNRALLTGILRDEWGFDGFVTSDWGAIHELMAHGVAATDEDAAVLALNAGVDMDMMTGLYRRNLGQALREGRVSQETIDQAVRRVLRTKFRFGLFDAPPVDPTRTDKVFPNAGQRALAREAAQKSFVLLKNEKNLLPISTRVKNIAVVGPLAEARCEQLGPHGAHGHCEDSVSYREGIEMRAAKAGMHVRYAAGCDVFCRDGDKIAKAVAVASRSDIIIAVMGEPRDASGEAASKAFFQLARQQRPLLEALIKTGKPVVLVLMAGRPLDIHQEVDRLGAVLMTWYPGTEGGNAVADILFGDVSPSGKLPLTWPRSVGQVPIYYNDLPSGRPFIATNRFTTGYYDESHLPLYPFGFGLSYGAFTYADLRVQMTAPAAGAMNGNIGSLDATVTVTNRGPRAAEEIVQAYVGRPVDDRSRPVRELKAFAKAKLMPGQSQDVTIHIAFDRLGFYDAASKGYLVKPGRYNLRVGSSSDATLEAKFSVPCGAVFSTRFSGGPIAPSHCEE